MSSNLKVNSLVPATGTEIGIGTTGGTIDFRCAATFGGNVTIGGTLTYDEVINIDSIGIVTARTGIKVPDDQRIRLGAANDLDIYHTTSGTSWIRHGNTAEYFVIEGNQMDFRSYTDSHYRVRMGTAVELRHNNIERLKTTSTGIDVSGDIDLDNGGSAGVNFKRNGTLKSDIEIGSASDQLAIRARGSSGHITFHTNTSTVERLRIDSAGRVGIGITNPISKIGVEGTGNGSTGSVNLGDSAAAASLFLKTHSGSGVGLALGGRNTGGQYIQAEYQNSTVASVRDLCINPHGGGVGIGTFAPNFGANPGADTIVFGTSQIERLRIGSDGTVTVKSEDLVFETTGKGIEFPNSVSIKQNVSNLYANVAAGNNNIEFQSNGTSFVKFRGTNGDVEIVDGNLKLSTSGHGIDFGATGGGSGTSNESEILTDYEHGEWTPVLQHYISGGFSAPSYSAAGTVVGRYTKIGNMVHISASFLGFNISNAHGSSFARITGLPFTSTNHPNHRDIMATCSDAFNSGGVVFSTYWNQTNLNSMRHGNGVFDWGVLQGGAADSLVVSGHYTAA